MKLKHLAALAASVAAGVLATSASAATFLFSFAGDLGLNGASGTLTATDNGDGTFTATGGTITGFGPAYADVPGATGVLIANPSAPAEIGSPMGGFIYDDQLLPDQNPLITNGGLLFSVDGYEVNIFSNGPGPDTYSLYSANGSGYTGNTNGNFALTEVGGGVPEPATWGLMLVGFGVAGAAFRSSRRNAVAAI